ncbi:MAG: DUF460 domain-containing protein [Thermoprotei archaeon]
MANNEKIVAGIDILPGYSPEAGKQPHYSLVLLRGEEVIQSYEDVSLTRLIRLLWEYKPDILAIDNVFELASNTHELVKLMQLLPPNTKLVQVTGWGPEAINIKTVARNMGIDIRGKLTPSKTAYIAALVAARGGGVIVKLAEEKTKIIITRGRSVSHGGMSFERYRRSIRAGILSVTREVRKILDENGFDYDLVFRKSKGGLEKSVFIVYAPRNKLYGLIKPLKTKSVKIVIKPIYREKLAFEPRREISRSSRKALILGVDPGVSIGIAVLDLNGIPLLVHSSKNIDRSDIVEMLIQFGEVVVVATDTAHPPELVRKLASSLNAVLYTPGQDLTTEEKQSIVNKLKERYPWLEVQDAHERDALAAAYKAYTYIIDKVKSIDSKISELGFEVDRDKIIADIIRGKSFAEAFEEELEKIVNTTLNKARRDNVKQVSDSNYSVEKLRERINELTNRISYLESVIRNLRNKLKEKDMVISYLQTELKALKHYNNSPSDRKCYVIEQENAHLRRIIEEKERDIEKLKHNIALLKNVVKGIIAREYTVIPRIHNLCTNSVRKCLDTCVKAVFVDEIYPIDHEAIKILKDNGVAIISSKDYGELYKELRIPIVYMKPVLEFDDFVIIKSDVFDKIDELWNIVRELDSTDEYKRIVKLIREYQESRKKKFLKREESSIT